MKHGSLTPPFQKMRGIFGFLAAIGISTSGAETVGVPPRAAPVSVAAGGLTGGRLMESEVWDRAKQWRSTIRMLPVSGFGMCDK